MDENAILAQIEAAGKSGFPRSAFFEKAFMPEAAKAVVNQLASLKRSGKIVAVKRPEDGKTVYFIKGDS